MDDSLTINGILNLGCAVLLPSNNNDAIPLEATFSTMSPLEDNLANSVIHKKVFLISS